MIIFLYGPDSYRRRKKLNEIIGEYRRKHLSEEYFDFSALGAPADEEFFRFQEFVSHNSLFEKNKLAVLENLFEAEFSGKNETIISDFLKANLESRDLILILCENKKPVKKFGFLLKKPVLSQEFEVLKGAPFAYFIKKEAEKRNIQLAPAALNFLTTVFEGDTWALINELDKLSLLGSKKFKEEELTALVDYYKPLESSSFFYGLNDFFNPFLGRRIIALEKLLLYGEEPAKIFNILAASRNSSSMLGKFADYDVEIKSGKLDYEEALTELIL